MSVAPFGVLLWLLSCTSKKVTSRLFSPAGENSPPRVAWQKPVPAATQPAAAGGIRNASKGCFFSCKKHPSCRCAAIHPPKIRFHGKGVPLDLALRAAAAQRLRSKRSLRLAVRSAAKGAAFGIRSLWKGWRNFWHSLPQQMGSTKIGKALQRLSIPLDGT